MNRNELRDRIRKLADQIEENTFIALNIVTTGFAAAIQVLLCVLVIFLIYNSQGLKPLELIGMVGGALIAAFVNWEVVSVFRDGEEIKLNLVFWLMAFIVGGGILAQYTETPDAAITLQTVLMAACMIAFPAWISHVATRFIAWLERPTAKEKEAEKKKRTLQADEVAAATQRLTDEKDAPPIPQSDQQERTMWYDY